MENSSKKVKIVIIGSGNVGTTIAYSLLIQNSNCYIYLVDTNKEKVLGECLDINNGVQNIGDSRVFCGNYEDCKNADYIILSVGRNRRKGEERSDLAAENIKIIDSVVDEINKYNTKALVIVVTNPVDIITYRVVRRLNVKKTSIIGTGCILDKSRVIDILSSYLECSVNEIECNVIGEHGNNPIVLWDDIKISKVKMKEYCISKKIVWDEEIKHKILKLVKSRGMDIIEKKGYTNYGIALCVSSLISSIIKNEFIVTNPTIVTDKLSESVDIPISLPCKITCNGVEEIVFSNINNINNSSVAKLIKTIKLNINKYDV